MEDNYEQMVAARIKEVATLGLKYDFNEDAYISEDKCCYVPILDIKVYDSKQWSNLISDIKTHFVRNSVTTRTI